MPYPWVASFSIRLRSASIVTPATARLGPNCSRRIAPMIGALIASLASTQATATESKRASPRVSLRLNSPHQLTGQEIRAADVADLSPVDQIVQGAQCLSDRSPGRIRAADKGRCNRLQRPNGCAHGREDVSADLPTPNGADRWEKVPGDDDETIALALQPAARRPPPADRPPCKRTKAGPW